MGCSRGWARLEARLGRIGSGPASCVVLRRRLQSLTGCRQDTRTRLRFQTNSLRRAMACCASWLPPPPHSAPSRQGPGPSSPPECVGAGRRGARRGASGVSGLLSSCVAVRSGGDATDAAGGLNRTEGAPGRRDGDQWRHSPGRHQSWKIKET